jgi:3-dehydroquinate synthetase
VVVSDSHVAPLHGEPFAEALRARGRRAELLTFPAGEAHKTRETKAGSRTRSCAWARGATPRSWRWEAG